MSVEIFIEYSGKPGYEEGDLLPLTRKQKLKRFFCSHRPNIRDYPRCGMTCYCGFIFAPDELIYIKPGYWQEYV